MRLVLEIQSGELAGRKFWIRLGERLLVGRTEQSELAVPDPRMSSVHFYVECLVTGCRVHDTRSTNGTFLNGKQISDEALNDGDIVLAGETRFRVGIEDEAAESARSSETNIEKSVKESTSNNKSAAQTVEFARPSIIRKTVVQPGPGQPNRLSTDETELPRELIKSRILAGDSAEFAAFAQRVAEVSMPYLIFEFSKIGRMIPSSITNRIFLYDWLPEKVLAGFSPVIIDPSVLATWPELFECGWGFDCLVCLFSPFPLGDLTDRLRKLTATGDSVEPRQKFASPAKLTELLTRGPEQFVQDFIQSVDAALVETSDGSARLFASEDFHDQLAEIGLGR